MYNEIKHINEGKFEVILDDGTTKEAGPNICGMIRYTYFEDYALPPDGWSVTREKLLNDYQAKVIPDIISGKITPNTMNY
jgi:hypothetical protein